MFIWLLELGDDCNILFLCLHANSHTFLHWKLSSLRC
jgi:hypothetical protein